MFMNYCQAVGHKRVESGRLISNVLENYSKIRPEYRLVPLRVLVSGLSLA